MPLSAQVDSSWRRRDAVVERVRFNGYHGRTIPALVSWSELPRARALPVLLLMPGSPNRKEDLLRPRALLPLWAQAGFFVLTIGAYHGAPGGPDGGHPRQGASAGSRTGFLQTGSGRPFSAGCRKLAVLDASLLAASLAPRPLLLMTGEQDPCITPASARRTFASAAPAYADGAADRLELWIEEGVGHGFSRRMESRALAWFQRWLEPVPDSP